jgi:hypothetical protein
MMLAIARDSQSETWRVRERINPYSAMRACPVIADLVARGEPVYDPETQRVVEFGFNGV